MIALTADTASFVHDHAGLVPDIALTLPEADADADASTADTPTADAPAMPRSRAALNLPGLCPLCGHDAVRKVLHTDGETLEAYRCPSDGEVTYRSGMFAGIGLDGEVADLARLVARRPGAAAHFIGMGSAPILSAGA